MRGKKVLLLVLVTIIAISLVASVLIHLLGYEFTHEGLVKKETLSRGGFTPLSSPPYAMHETGKRFEETKASGTTTYSYRMVIVEGRMTIEVEEGGVEKAVREIVKACKELNGYVAESRMVKERAYVIVKVPSGSLEDFMERVRGLGKVLSEETSARDVTEQYIDLEARLENAKREEKRLLEILNMAKTVDEVLKVEEYLKRIREEIERLEAQKKYLERRVEYATVLVEIVRRKLEWPEFDIMPAVMIGLRVLYTSIYVLTVLGFLSIVIIPVSLLVYVVYLIVRKRVKGFLKELRGETSQQR